ncbi:hypothetical protein BC832DRAFT_538196 [Gaertneriomyces semiglobifer]|nr:hypothetical protein BC832DRAFT_538196 [Gaertneriomyces semiglobifer]
MTSIEDLATINYYLRRGLPRHIHDLCRDRLKRRIGDPALLFWRGMAVLIEGRPTEALTQLTPLLDKRDFVLAAPLACIHAHQLCSVVDHDAVAELQAKLDIAQSSSAVTSSSSSGGAWVQAGWVDFAIGRWREASEWAKRAMERGEGPESCVLMGWAVERGEEGRRKRKGKAREWFERAVEARPGDLEAQLSLAQYLHHTSTSTATLSRGLDIITPITLSNPTFLPALITKLYLHLSLSQYDQLVETAHKLLKASDESVDAYIALAMNGICKDGDYKNGTQWMERVRGVLSKLEPQGDVWWICAQGFLEVAGGNQSVLKQCQQFLSPMLAPTHPSSPRDFVTLGQIHLALSSPRDAISAFQKALQLDSNHVPASVLILLAQLELGNVKDVRDQVELFHELGVREEMLSVVAARMAEGEVRGRLLREAWEIWVEKRREGGIGLEYYVNAQPSFLMTLVREMVSLLPASPPSYPSEETTQLITTATSILQRYLSLVPGSSLALYLLARTKSLSTDNLGEIVQLATRALKLDNTNVDAYLLLASVYLRQKNVTQAQQYLEMALSYNFSVRKNIRFWVLKAKCHNQRGEAEEARKVLEEAMELVRKGDATGGKSVGAGVLEEHVEVYEEYIDVLGKLGDTKQATQILHQALSTLPHSMHPRLTLLSAKLLVNQDPDKAIAQLGTIPSSSPYFREAKYLMAEIYLKQKDMRAYVRCFKDVVEKEERDGGNPDAWIGLGDAWGRVNEPEKAIKAYQTALTKPSLSPTRHIQLSLKIGAAYIKTHQYDKAVTYYSDTLMSLPSTDTPEYYDLRYALGELYVKLQRFPELTVLFSDMETEEMGEDTTKTRGVVRDVWLMGKGYRKNREWAKAAKMLERAREGEIQILSRESLLSDTKEGHKRLSSICCDLAEVYQAWGKMEDARTWLEEAVERDRGNKEALEKLTRIHLTLSAPSKAQQSCTTLLLLSDTPQTTLLMSQILAQQGQADEAIKQLFSVLDKTPREWAVLEGLIEVLRDLGKLKDLEAYWARVSGTGDEKGEIDNAPRKSGEGDAVMLDAGYQYCRGLYLRYTAQTALSLRSLNFCRRDRTYGPKSLVHMIWLLLNPDNDVLGASALKPHAPSTPDELLGIATAHKLIAELVAVEGDTLRTKCLSAWCATLTKRNEDVERGIGLFMSCLDTEKEYVPAMWGVAAAYMMLQQQARARTWLERVQQRPFDERFKEEFCGVWMLSADLHLQTNKPTLATPLLTQVLSHIATSPRTHEYLGYIHEKSSSHALASQHYQTAFAQLPDPAIGYKLAWSLMKAGKNVECVDVCHEVLRTWPEYEGMREVLGRGRMGIRCP